MDMVSNKQSRKPKAKTTAKTTRTVKHTCSQAETIQRLDEVTGKLSLILIGNGEPEKGMAYKVLASIDDRKQIHTNINDIKTNITDLGIKVDAQTSVVANLITAQATAEKLRIETAKKAHDKTVKYITIIGICITALIGTLNLFKTDKVQTSTSNTEAKVDNINTPVKDERSGKLMLYPIGEYVDSLRKQDSIKYDIK